MKVLERTLSWLIAVVAIALFVYSCSMPDHSESFLSRYLGGGPNV